MASSSGSRRYYVVGDGAPTRRPRFDPARSLRENVLVIATWEWGDRRAQWAVTLVDELGLGTADGDAGEWVAAVLCAAAADSGRNRTSGWSRTLTALTEMTGVSRDAMLARWAQLSAVAAQPTGTATPAGAVAVDESVMGEPAGAA